MSSQYLNQCWFTVNYWPLWKNLWCLNKNNQDFFASENVICKMVSSLSSPQWLYLRFTLVFSSPRSDCGAAVTSYHSYWGSRGERRPAATRGCGTSHDQTHRAAGRWRWLFDITCVWWGTLVGRCDIIAGTSPVGKKKNNTSFNHIFRYGLNPLCGKLFQRNTIICTCISFPTAAAKLGQNNKCPGFP